MRHAAILAVLASIASSHSPAQTPVQTVTVQLTNFHFRPSQLVLDRGRTYRLRLVDTSSGGHDFTAAQFFRSSRIDPADAPKISRGKVKVRGRGTSEVLVTPELAGSYHLACTHFMHSALGMTGTIRVR